MENKCINTVFECHTTEQLLIESDSTVDEKRSCISIQNRITWYQTVDRHRQWDGRLNITINVRIFSKQRNGITAKDDTTTELENYKKSYMKCVCTIKETMILFLRGDTEYWYWWGDILNVTRIYQSGDCNYSVLVIIESNQTQNECKIIMKE